MLGCKPISSPMSSSLTLSAVEGMPFEDATLYRSTRSALNYLAFTCPVISFAANRLCQFMYSPIRPHWVAVKRVLLYLKHTFDMRLEFHISQSPSLQAFGDTDWAGDPDNHRSTMGHCIYYGGNLVLWGSRKQATMPRSSTKAEYCTITNVTSEVTWLTFLLHELGITISASPIIWCDNIGATDMAANLFSMFVL